MLREGKVSLWLGRAPSREALEEYIQFRYTEDGDWIPSQFAADFALPYYDEGTREAEVYDEPRTSVRSLLAGASYEDVVVPQFVAQLGEELSEPVNAIMLVYGLEYDGVPRKSHSSTVSLRPVGVASYRVP
jgi:Immunity protein 22